MNYRVPSLSETALNRIGGLKSRSVEVVQEVCPERARYLTETYSETRGDPVIMRRAKALANVLGNMTVFILPGELLAGNQASALRAAPIFPEYTVDWIVEEIDELAKRPGDRFAVRPEVREELLEICRWWKGKTVHARCLSTLPEPVKRAYETGVLSATGNMTSGDGHIVLDFPKALGAGVNGIVEEAEGRLAGLGAFDPDDARKRTVLESVVVAYRGVLNFARRYADLALTLASIEKNADRKRELEELSRTCGSVPANPARTFREALQSVWFMHLVSQIESNGHSMSLGRFDQYMYEYYRRDLESGLITAEEATELLAHLWIKMFGVTKIRPWSHTRFSGGGPTYQNLTLGGVTPEGKDAVNELTILCLDAVSLTRLPQPNVSARVHPSCPPLYLRKCVEVIKLGFGMPALHNDELMIPSLLARGVKLEDANDYAICGCIEPIIPGRHGYRAAGMSFTNFPKVLELALNGGKDPRTGIRIGRGGGDLASFPSFEEVLEAFKSQMEEVVRLRVLGEHVIDRAIEELVPEPFCTGLVRDCIRRGKTPKEGGAVYDMVTGPETGVTNAGNALAALKKLVFEERAITGARLKEALDRDFEGPEGERIRQMLVNRAPKFGNDDDYVDELTRETYMIFIRELEKYKNARFGRGPVACVNYPCTATISGNVPSGFVVGATPDGRKAGEPLAEGCSPYRGTDRLGPTAVVKSVSKMPNILITGGNLLNQRVNPSSLESEEGMKKLEDLVRTFFELKGWHIQFNVISTETLRNAQREPENYRDLVVRVAGYSALFTVLEPKTQDDIIARTVQSL
jgi:pyruvate formate-lyase/glycerol dehydratase family glycyl radical enzyme